MQRFSRAGRSPLIYFRAKFVSSNAGVIYSSKGRRKFGREKRSLRLSEALAIVRAVQEFIYEQ